MVTQELLSVGPLTSCSLLIFLCSYVSMTKWKGESNKRVHEKSGMGPCANGVKCVVCVCE